MTARRILTVGTFGAILLLQGCAGFIAGCGRHGNVCGSIQLPPIGYVGQQQAVVQQPVVQDCNGPIFQYNNGARECRPCQQGVWNGQVCVSVINYGNRNCQNPLKYQNGQWVPQGSWCREGDILWNVDMSDIKLDVPVPQKQEPINPFDL